MVGWKSARGASAFEGLREKRSTHWNNRQTIVEEGKVQKTESQSSCKRGSDRLVGMKKELVNDAMKGLISRRWMLT